MQTIRLTLWGFLIGASGLWLMAANWPETWSYFQFRDLINQYSGLIAMGAMSLCMLLAVRPMWLESWLHGLDKGYRLHKWLGITALISTLAHFWFTKGTKWMIGWGWLERPQRQRRFAGNADGPLDVEHWLGSFRSVAEDIGEWAFYLVLVLLAMALVKQIPYHWFKKWHKWLAAAYLALVFHAVILVKFEYWSHPIGWLFALLLIAGTVSAGITLLNRIGATRKTLGTVASIQPLTQSESVDLHLEVPHWAGHQAGQFVFIRSLGENQEAHPFTLASATAPLRVLIKHLGDYTAHSAHYFQAGTPVEIEGPYGCFTFEDSAKTQIWIAAGIGITPFIARLEKLATTENTQPIFLFYCYRNADKRLLAELQQKAALANVQLILWNSTHQGHLNAIEIQQRVGNLSNSSAWFCGNRQFGEQLKATLPVAQFHQELFEMR